MGIFPNRGEHKKYLKAPPRYKIKHIYDKEST